jgi:hypothetical protein
MLFGLLLASRAVRAHPGHGEDTEVAADSASESGKAGAVPQVSIEVRGAYRYITSNGIPNHEPGKFPNRNNPNSIWPQRYQFRVPVAPKVNDRPIEPAGPTLFGVAVNGVPFDPGTAEWWRDDPSRGWRMEAIGGPRNLGLDRSNAHVQPGGQYHYHGVPLGLVASIARGKSVTTPVLIGWAADGFPIYTAAGYSDAMDPKSTLKVLRSSYRLRQGSRPGGDEGPGGNYDGAYTRDWEYVAGSGDLDECNGRFGVTPEFRGGTYYYVVTEEYPFVPRYFRSTPDASFQRKRPPGAPGGRR